MCAHRHDATDAAVAQRPSVDTDATMSPKPGAWPPKFRRAGHVLWLVSLPDGLPAETVWPDVTREEDGELELLFELLGAEGTTPP